MSTKLLRLAHEHLMFVQRNRNRIEGILEQLRQLQALSPGKTLICQGKHNFYFDIAEDGSVWVERRVRHDKLASVVVWVDAKGKIQDLASVYLRPLGQALKQEISSTYLQMETPTAEVRELVNA